jgi:lipopolysaccharide transport system ATP-binding protein
MNSIISVENLAKKYTLQHQGGGPCYRRLSEELVDAVKQPFRRLFPSLAPPAENGQRASTAPPWPAPGSQLPASSEEFWALRDVSFEVREGEVLGIIGRNGAGKSTLLKVLGRITEPTAGRVTIRGRVASLLEVGTGFHPELTGRENIFLNGAILGMTRAEIRRKFDEIVAFAEVERFLDTPVKHFSSGMYVRLAFAVSAHLEPEILVVDEVLAVGDAEFQRKCLGKMSEVAQGGRTVLFVSHNVTAIQTLCSSAIRLEAGRLVQIGPVAEAVASYNCSVRNHRAGRGQELGCDLLLRRFEFSPAQIVSGGSTAFSLEVVPQKPTCLREIGILICSQYGSRVALLDLRQKGIRALRLQDQPLTIDGTIAQLPLVEGEYHVGLWLQTDDYADRYLDITSFSVTMNSDSALYVPYPAIERGCLDLDFEAQAIEGVAEADCRHMACHDDT